MISVIILFRKVYTSSILVLVSWGLGRDLMKTRQAHCGRSMMGSQWRHEETHWIKGTWWMVWNRQTRKMEISGAWCSWVV